MPPRSNYDLLWRAGHGYTVGDLELIQAIESRHFVGFRQRGIVEDAIDKVGDRASMRHHCLPDMNQFGGLGPNNMDAEELQRLAVKQQF